MCFTPLFWFEKSFSWSYGLSRCLFKVYTKIYSLSASCEALVENLALKIYEKQGKSNFVSFWWNVIELSNWITIKLL